MTRASIPTWRTATTRSAAGDDGDALAGWCVQHEELAFRADEPLSGGSCAHGVAVPERLRLLPGAWAVERLAESWPIGLASPPTGRWIKRCWASQVEPYSLRLRSSEEVRAAAYPEGTSRRQTGSGSHRSEPRRPTTPRDGTAASRSAGMPGSDPSADCKKDKKKKKENFCARTRRARPTRRVSRGTRGYPVRRHDAGARLPGSRGDARGAIPRPRGRKHVVPPRPIAFDSATSTCVSRASFGP